MPEIQLAIVDKQTSRLLLDAEHHEIAGVLADALDPHLGAPIEQGCARPTEILHLVPANRCVICGKQYGALCAEGACSPFTGKPLATIRISGVWHDSLIEGPGRRSVVRMQGC